MQVKPILIVADSRGRHLRPWLNQEFTDVHFNLIWRGGLRLDQAADFAQNVILTTRPKIVYILCGICDLTRLTARNPNHVTLRFSTVHDLVFYYMSNVDLALANVFSLCPQIGHHIMVVFPTLTGMDLSRYNRYPPGLFSPQQHVLNESILRINRAITALNYSMSISTPFLATAVHPRRRYQNRFVYARLYDGCHLSYRLNYYWARRLYRNAIINLARYDAFELANITY